MSAFTYPRGFQPNRMAAYWWNSSISRASQPTAKDLQEALGEAIDALCSDLSIRLFANTKRFRRRRAQPAASAWCPFPLWLAPKLALHLANARARHP